MLNADFNEEIKVFEAGAYFSGKWSSEGHPRTGPLFNSFINKEGYCLLYFLPTEKVTTVRVFFGDEKYIDTKGALLSFNLTKSEYNKTTSTFYLNRSNTNKDNLDWEIITVEHLVESDELYTGYIDISMKLTSISTKTPFDALNSESVACFLRLCTSWSFSLHLFSSTSF